MPSFLFPARYCHPSYPNNRHLIGRHIYRRLSQQVDMDRTLDPRLILIKF